ncbi:MAG: hypothetical protein LBR26_05405 [Prevotella sp.]|nr:hypothetical protein [Prevotella sp.]
MKTKKYEISESGYNPKIQLGSNSFSVKFFYENSAVKNTVSERIRNKAITISNSIK